MKNQKITAAYNEFRNNQAPYFYNKAQVGTMTIEAFENWFDKREATFFAIMDKAGM